MASNKPKNCAAVSPRLKQPITLHDLEECLDILADVISRSGDVAELRFPLWRRLEKEIENMRESDRIKADIRERATHV
ncbi:hypothetical protein [Phyllobacterium zundukense]|uniref:Uncharacterized protein n=1 Tax=Phyllobacterium zundukense TaxID=1867719 RepID=A0A2N9W4X2_9HYPH|nr:hypothetical protein [Phyllobacterium zundukense]ATU91746.1 hypothetical protein BLM14_09035 [Phyllobacterium zundukense]PIO46790.1 hypothetical protein B5P45_03050 [Phyllobacterium zundukense]